MNMAEQPFLIADQTWIKVRDGNQTALAIFDRHYTSRRAHVRKIDQFVGPGAHTVLLTPDARALFVWRKFKDDSGQTGVNCAVFRNECAWGGVTSSSLIIAAERIAWERWPGERLYTYVDARRVRSTNPGYCFICAGWRHCGYTKRNKLRILEKLP